MTRLSGLFVGLVLIVIVLLSCLLPDTLTAETAVHTFDCKNCHIPSLSVEQLGGGNVCLSCHDDTLNMALGDSSTGSTNTAFNLLDASNAHGNNPGALAGSGQTSHNWSAPDIQPRAGAVAPSRTLHPQFYSRFGSSQGKVTCSRCHNPHADRTNPQLLIMGAGSAQQMCLACHVTWNQGAGMTNVTHPVGIDYAAAATAHPGQYASAPPEDDGNLSTNGPISLFNGKVFCGSCHQVHFADSNAATADIPENFATLSSGGGDGKLLKGDGAGRADKSGLCQSCHAYAAHGGTSGERVGCLSCHGGHASDQVAPNFYMLRKNVTTATYGTASGLDYSSTGVFNSDTKYLFWNDLISGTADGYCEKCHGDAQTIPDGGAGFHTNAAVCTNCHRHGGSTDGGFLADCVGCHSIRQGNRAAITSQFSANSHHVQGTTISSRHCYQCHWEATSDGKINPVYHSGTAVPGAPVDLVIYGAGTRPTTYSAEATAIQYTADGSRTEITKLNGHCLACHGDMNNAATPFGDGKTPKQYAWDNNSIGSRYTQTGTTPWGKYTGPAISPKAARSKAYSAHGNAVANEGGWDLNETWPNTRAGTTNVVCFDCHNAHGANLDGTTTSYGSATVNGGILKDTTAGGGGYSATYKPVAGGATETNNRRNPGASLCMDCHLTASGGASQPWGYQETYGASEKVMGYTDTPYLGPGTGGPQLRYPYKGEKKSKAGHFGASSPLKNSPMATINGLCTPCHDPHGVSPTLGTDQQYGVPLLKGTWLTSPYKEDVAAPNISMTNSLISVGTSLRIDGNTFVGDVFSARFSDVIVGIGETPEQFAGLCLKCHPKERLTDGVTHDWKSKDRIHESVKGWDSSGATQHYFSCSKCHSPHMTGLPRLMITNCMDSNHKGQQTGYPPELIPRYAILWNPTNQYYPGGHMPKNKLCHAAQNGYRDYSTDQSWNLVTPWNTDKMTIANGPYLYQPFVTGAYPDAPDFKFTVWWTTDNPSRIRQVEYGPTPALGLVSSSVEEWSNSATIDSLVPLSSNHATWYYRAVSTSYAGNRHASATSSFYLSLPPVTPTRMGPDLQLVDCSSSPCSVTYEWNPTTDPDGGPIEYAVETCTTSRFAPIDGIQRSDWTSGTSLTLPAPGVGYYYWRVVARDANHTSAQDPVSPGSSVGVLIISNSWLPSIGYMQTPADGFAATTCNGTYGPLPFQWGFAYPAALEYNLEISRDPTFTAPPDYVMDWWQTPDWPPPWGARPNWSTTLNVPPGQATTYYWRVRARHAITLAPGPWSAVRSFMITDTGICP